MIRQELWLGLMVTMLDIQTGLSESPTRHDKKIIRIINNKIIIFVNKVLITQTKDVLLLYHYIGCVEQTVCAVKMMKCCGFVMFSTRR